jgi:pimeloyl-ACP methyl ester carboxylesterase
MAEDARRLLDHLGHRSACPVIGYSMGARIAAYLARHPERVRCAVWGGMGRNLITGLEDSEEIISALTAESLADQVTAATGRQFRIFADHSTRPTAPRSPRAWSSREPMPEAEVAPDRDARARRGGRDRRHGRRSAGAGRTAAARRSLHHPQARPHAGHGDPQFKAATLEFLLAH